MKSYLLVALTLFTTSFSVIGSGVEKEIISESCSGHQVLKVAFDSDNKPTLKVLNTMNVEARLWKENTESLPKYLSDSYKLKKSDGSEFDPRSKDHGYEVFSLAGLIDLNHKETTKIVVFRANALRVMEPTIVSGKTKIVIYPTCDHMTPFHNILISAVDTSKPMHLKGILSLYVTDDHMDTHVNGEIILSVLSPIHRLLNPRPNRGLKCYLNGETARSFLPKVEDCTFKLTNAVVKFIMKPAVDE